MKRLLTSCFGLGRLPVAPGTWGSLPPVLIFVLTCYLAAPPVVLSIVMVLLVVIASFVCVKFAPAVIEATGKDDPHEVVADEFAGQALVFVAMPAVITDKIFIIALIGFVVFRIFDIIKPWPIRKLERLPKGWGILADDLLAAVYAAIVLQIVVRFWLSA